MTSRLALGWLCCALTLAGCGARGGLDPLDRIDAGPRDAGLGPLDAGAPDAGQAADAGLADAGAPSDIGAPCDGPAACRSATEVVDVPACIGPASDWPNPLGWEGGYCTAQCVPSSAPADGEPLARDGCPHGALCVPTFQAGVGVCLLACETDDGCRTDAGYFCRRDFDPEDADPEPLPVGVCVAQHCRSRPCVGVAECSC